MKRTLKVAKGGGGDKTLIPTQKSSNFKTLVALGLSAILPSLAFSAESDEALKQLLTTAPQSPSDSKAKSVENYSPVVDLRSSRAVIEETSNPPFVNGGTWDNDTQINVNIDTINYLYDGENRIFTATNNAKVTMNFVVNTPQNSYDSYGILTANTQRVFFQGTGSFDITASITGTNLTNGQASFIGIWDDGMWSSLVGIHSTFKFQAQNNVQNFLYIYSLTNYGDGKYFFNSPSIEIDMSKSTNSQKNIISVDDSMIASTPKIYINTQENNTSLAYSQNSILKFTGDLRVGKSNLYAHFTNQASYLKGSLYLDKSSSVVFSNNSSMIGDINIQGNGTNSITFDNASFIGVVKNSQSSSQSNNNGVNTTITFKNTAGKIFGSTTDGVVDSTYKGTIIGTFDVSANSMTIINGSSDGSKGFFGSGTNTLTFDFRNNASSSSSNSAFTIGGGNANSVYVMNAFQAKGQTELDLSSLSANGGSLFSKIKNAGIAIKEGTTISNNNNTNNVLQGTLLFKNTNIKVGNNGNGDNALFAKKENILTTSTNALNGLALGAMFGNATWNDANKDGYITSDEIIANAGGANYKLTGTNGATSSNGTTDDRTSTGNIGKDNDSIKKQIGFIFADGTEQNGYVFGGNKQGYSGTIKGGTADSKYYFANAGYVNRTQIEDAKGDLVLFNTAFRGDLGVKNKDVSIMLDFSDNRNGLRSEAGTGNANIVGAGSKNITFNFTGNTLKEKFKGAVVGDSTKANTNGKSPTSGGSSTDNDTATYTMLNLVKYSSDGTKDGDGSLKVTTTNRNAGTKTLIDAIQEAGLTNFNKQDQTQLSAYQIPSTSAQPSSRDKDSTTNVELFSKTNTTLALRGTSLDASGITFSDYKYDFAFGSGLGEIEGVTIQDSKLKGTIDLSTNNNTGHKIVMRGDSIEGGSAEIKFNTASGKENFGTGKGGVFVYDDYTATRSASSAIPTLKLSGLSQTNYLTTGSGLDISKTNLEGDIWASDAVGVNLNFTNGNTWKMDNSGIYIKNASDSFRITGKVQSINGGSTTPTLKLRLDKGNYFGRMELINTGMTVKLWEQGNGWTEGTYMGNSFNLRGTSLETYWGNGGSSGSKDGLHGYTDEGIKLVFAKGTNVETNVEKSQKDGTSATYYKITDEGSGEGNYIAESTLTTTKLVTRSVNAVFVGENSYDSSGWGSGGKITQNATFAFANAGTDSNRLDGSKLKNLLTTSNATTTVTLEGTSLGSSGSGIVSENKGATTFNMTFVKGTSGTYISDLTDQYTDLARTTNAGGALKDSILKIAQSTLDGGINFQNSNFNVLFVGDASQSLDGSGSNGSAKVFKGGSASSVVTFRDSDLKAGNGTSSLQNIKGTIAFDLSHNGEDMQISGTLSNMFGNGSNGYNGTGKYQTKFGDARGDQVDGLSFDKLVFVKLSQANSSNTLKTLQTEGNYFNDTDTFGNLSQADYSKFGYIKDLDDNKNSSLTLKGGSTIALKGANQEIVFIGSESHGFDDNGTTKTENATKLGDSTGSTLTFIDAGTLKVENLINKNSSSNAQQGKGTINLIGSTRIELKDISTGVGARNSTKTLTLYSANSSTTGSNPSTIASPASSSTAITGAGITINAVFTGSNALEASSNGIQTSGGNGQAINNGHKASTANIGQAGEETTYHILFDYTSSGLTFGTHHAYTGNIYGLTSDSIIKFKNAGYINQAQIQNTQATILLDNTQLKGDFRGDVAILDFRNNRPAISGNILTSDTRTTSAGGSPTANVLSQKVLTFDLTGSTNALGFSGNIQAGYKVAPDYQTDAQSILTFQNAPTMTLGNDNGAGARGAGTANPSDFIQSLAKDVGFSGIANAKTEEPTSQAQAPAVPSSPVGTIALAAASTIDTNTSYILKGTKLAFQGTNITANGSDKAITEDTYELDLSFDNRNEGRGTTGLGETLGKSTLTANSITMGEYDGSRPLGLSLSFKDSGSLAGGSENNLSNTLNVKLKDNARFNLNAESSNGNIGTLILSQNNGGTTTALANVAKDSSLIIGAGSMNFIGKFSQNTTPSATSANAGAINATFNGTNKIYGTLAGRGEMNVTISGEGVFDSAEMTNYSFAKPTNFGDADVLLDASNATSGTITLSYTSGKVGVKGKAYVNSTSSSGSTNNAQSSFTAINLSNYVGNENNSLTLQGAFDLGNANLNFTGEQFKVTDNLFFKVNSGSSITLKDIKIKNDTPSNLVTQNTSVQKTLSIGAIGGSERFGVNLTLTNLDPNLIVELTNTSRTASINDWGNSGTWNIRGTNIQLTTAFWAENNTNLKKFVFAKGNGTEVTKDPASQSQTQQGALTLDQLKGDDKINQSALSGSVLTANDGSGDGQNVRNVIMKNGEMTFIGKESLAVDADKQKFDGTQGKITFGLYNTILKSGSVLLDNTNKDSHSNLGKNANIQDIATLRGTDTFNLSLAKSSTADSGRGLNNSTINAVFVNGSNLSSSSTAKTDTAITGNTYINAENGANEALKKTLTQYATSNAGGALSDSILKTLQSKAYGNITLQSETKNSSNQQVVANTGVTANMKFIGENSHSFDGKTIVEGSGTDAKVYYYQGSKTIADITGNDPDTNNWNQLEIGSGNGKINGAVYVNSSNHPSVKANTKYAQLIGGNANSRFDFDHTTVALDLVKFAGGKTIVYNSTVSGQIAVKASGGVGNDGVTGRTSGTLSILENSSTTLFFNAKMTEKAQNGSTLSTGSTDQELTDIAKKYIDYHYTSAETGLGINLDLSNAHQMTKSNLTNGSSGSGSSTYTLGETDKQTNIVLIGKDSVKTENASAATGGGAGSSGTSSNNNGAGIDLSFLPADTKNGGKKYSYTIISGGELDGKYINTKLGANNTNTPDASGAELTVFGTSKVTLVDTYVVGERNFAQVGFIDTEDTRNQKSSWGGNQGIEQFLIFDFHNGENNNKLNNSSGNVITNTDANSRYIFTSIFADSTAKEARVLTLSSNGLRTAINTQLKTTQNVRTTNGQDVIKNDVKGYLGLRGVSIKGNIDESVAVASAPSAGAGTGTGTSGTQSSGTGSASQVTRDVGASSTSVGNKVDIVFNSTSNISYIDGFDESGKHTFEIKDIGANKVANITGINTDISGYAVLMGNNGGAVTIKGDASKDITFIGEGSVEGGFDKLKIEGGDNYSHYTFYSVGNLGDTFLQNVGLQKNTTASDGVQKVDNSATMATAGTFTFANSTIRGNINVDANTNGIASVVSSNADTQTSTQTPVSKLIFDNVVYSGELSGSLEKDLKFAKGSNNITIKGGSNTSSYDFSNLAGESIALNIDLSDNDKYLTSTITGFDGDVSLVGSIKLAKHHRETNAGATYTNSFTFNNNAKWTMTDNSRVMNLSLSNEGINYNLDLASAPRSSNAVVTQESGSVNTDLRVLEVGNLTSNGGQVLLGTMIDESNQSNSKSDKIKASVISSGTLYITAKDATLATGSFDTSDSNAIVLVTADTAYGEVKGAERKEGLSYVTTTLEHQVSANTNSDSGWTTADENNTNSSDSHRWVLSGFDTAVNQELVDESGFIVSNPYRMLVIETNNLNKRMGDLRDNDYNQGSWIRVFNGSDSGEGAKNLYTNIQLGYDYGTPAIGAKNYTGVAFSTSIVDIDGNQYSGKANTYSLGVYNAYIADSGLYVDTIAKYLYTDQKLTPSGSSDSSFGSHALSLGVEVGYRAYMGESNFYFETQAEAIGGIIFGVKDINMGIIGGRDINGELKTTTALNTRVGLVQGYSLKTENGFRADFRLGASLVNEFISEANPVMLYDGITEASTSIGNDTKVVLNVGTNLILTDQWRVYIDAERSFGGSRNVDYQANIGARFSFGDKISSLPKPSKPLPLKTSENKNNK